MRKQTKAKILCLTLAMQFFAFMTFAQDLNVKGRVTDEKGAPVLGATVIVKGSASGTSTDGAGDFSISVAKGATLLISAINFEPKEVKVKTSVQNVTLTSTDKALGEVVIIGYGNQRKEAVTGSVASISGNNLRDVPTPNISQALQGRVAGVDISQTSTKPGATMQIRIRGERSLATNSNLGINDPLIVLDGIPYIGSLGDINPTILKVLTFLRMRQLRQFMAQGVQMA